MTEIERGPVTRTAGAFNGWRGGVVTLSDNLAVALATLNTAVLEILIQNDHDSAGYILVGNAFGQWIRLAAGESITIPINDLDQIHVVAPGGSATVRWAAMT